MEVLKMKKTNRLLCLFLTFVMTFGVFSVAANTNSGLLAEAANIIESGNLLSYMMKKNDYEYKYGHIFSCQTPYYFASLDYDTYHTKITSATITYMDGSKISLTGKQLEKAQSN